MLGIGLGGIRGGTTKPSINIARIKAEYYYQSYKDVRILLDVSNMSTLRFDSITASSGAKACSFKVLSGDMGTELQSWSQGTTSGSLDISAQTQITLQIYAYNSDGVVNNIVIS